jgi:RNA recognition motif-containing protein
MFRSGRRNRCLASTLNRNIIGPREKKEVGMQGSKLYVGNLGHAVDKKELEDLFAGYGQVKEVRIIEGKGFGFVEMVNREDAEKAKEGLDGSDFKGFSLKVDEARPPRKRPGGGGGNRPPRDRGRRDFRRY